MSTRTLISSGTAIDGWVSFNCIATYNDEHTQWLYDEFTDRVTKSLAHVVQHHQLTTQVSLANDTQLVADSDRHSYDQRQRRKGHALFHVHTTTSVIELHDHSPARVEQSAISLMAMGDSSAN